MKRCKSRILVKEYLVPKRRAVAWKRCMLESGHSGWHKQAAFYHTWKKGQKK